MHRGTISKMKLSSIWLVLLTMGICGVAAREALHPASLDISEEGSILIPQNNRNGWVNPEDLPPMPQCITQQDQTTWLRTMTRCTSKRCTKHFGVICTHHQWLTQLSCLSISFSSDIIKGYLPYCSRSVLAEAQLYFWIHIVAGRTWLVDVGDANRLQNLSPASLAEGYAAVDVIEKAPTCLTGSDSASSMEAFQHVMASCGFKSKTQHTGNAARPWEYSEPLRSMIALDSETVGYNLTRHNIRQGDYFDKDCFCGAFTIDSKKEPCSGLGNLDLTRERLWLYATCGPKSVPENWTDALKTTEFAYIPIEDWHWPTCVTDMPNQLIELTGQCATDACERDSGGYCRVIRAFDRVCFCREISYDSCGGSCHIFETRIDYIKWLHNLCGSVQDWHGLPDNWRQLAAPTHLEMIPWRWTLKSSNDSNLPSMTSVRSIMTVENCASPEWKLGSFALINIATLLAPFIGRRASIYRDTRGFLWHLDPRYWFLTGALIAALQLLGNWFNVLFVQETLGYEDVPVIQLMLLWCSVPRLNWLTVLLASVQPFEPLNFAAVASSLCAETILQVFSSYYIIMTFFYGLEHSFYLKYMERLGSATPAKFMYVGALLWLIVIINAFARFTALPNECWTWLEEEIQHHWVDRNRDLEETSSTRSEGRNSTVYGTFPVERQNNKVSQKAFVRLCRVTVISMFLLWIAQWLFWGGFIGLSLEEFCPPKLGILTAVWIAFSLAGAIVGAIQ